jgi:hypothetical protein
VADSSVAITAGTGTPIRVLTGLGAGSADQQVMTLADSAGNLLGTAGAPVPTAPQTPTPAGTNTIGNIRKAPSATGTITSVTAAAADTTLLAANTNRLGATFYNDSTAVLYLALTTTASTTAYTVQVPAGGYYELPNDGCGYVGAVHGIWSAANGAARVTELTP